MTPHHLEMIRALAADHRSGATALTGRAIAILQAAGADGPGDVRAAAAALCRAQPSMAPIWVAAGLAVADAADGGRRLERLGRQRERAAQAIARLAGDLLALGAPAPLRLVTVSASDTVLACLRALAAAGPLEVACAEGRPAMEGRTLAVALAAAGVTVASYTDAAIGTALAGAGAVVVGADAAGPGWIINKCGTAAVAALAAARGIPVYALAGREKFLPEPLASRLPLRAGPPDEVWPDAPGQIDVRNPYFERVPADLLAGIITDGGPVGGAAIAELCQATAWQIGTDALSVLSSWLDASPDGPST